MKHLGINIGGQDYYDSGQLSRNLTVRNPGFEAEMWSSILNCQAATATTCTDSDPNNVWPANFLQGATFQVHLRSSQGADWHHYRKYRRQLIGEHWYHLNLLSAPFSRARTGRRDSGPHAGTGKSAGRLVGVGLGRRDLLSRYNRSVVGNARQASPRDQRGSKRTVGPSDIPILIRTTDVRSSNSTARTR